MVFKIENIGEKEKEYIKSFRFRNPLSDKCKFNIPTRWVTEPQRHYYLLCLGAGGGVSYDSDEYPPSYYKLIVDSKVIDIQAKYKWEGNGTTGVKVWWKIIRIKVDNSIEMDSDEIKQIVKEIFAMESQAIFCRNLQNVYFDLIAEPIFLIGGGDK